MACNFTIHPIEKNGYLYIQLKGDFDGSSAMQLLDHLKNCRPSGGKIFINTDGLKEIHPFGKAVLEKQIAPQNGRAIQLIFTGSNREVFM